MAVLDDMIADPTINGQHVDVDNEFGGQCWDLVELYAERLGVPKAPWAITLNTDGSAPAGYAKNAWLYFNNNPNLVAHFDQIPAGQHQRGDIGVYNGHGDYVEGHINIFTDSGNGVFQENADPDGSPAHETQRAPTYLLGALRLKGGDIVKPSAADVKYAFNTFTIDGRDPTAKQVSDYMAGDIRNMYHDLLFYEILAKAGETQQAFKDLQPWLPINADQVAYYPQHPRGWLYRDLAYGAIKHFSSTTPGADPVVTVNGKPYVPKV